MHAFQGILATAILILLVDFGQGQTHVKVADDEVYIFPRYLKNHYDANQQCLKYRATLISNFNSTAKGTIISIVGTESIWLMDNQTSESGECKAMDMSTQTEVQRNCSAELKIVCVAKALKNVTENDGTRFEFSIAKLRHSFAKYVCNKLKGDLVTITSQSMQDFLARVANTSVGSGYFINSNNKNTDATKGYSNWAPQNVSTSNNLHCVVMDQQTAKWNLTDCHVYKRFICEWKRKVTSTTSSSTTASMTTSSTTAEMTTTTKSNEPTTMEPTTTSTSENTTSGSTAIYTFGNGSLTVMLIMVTFMKLLLN